MQDNHWQNCIVERHMCTFNVVLNIMMFAGDFRDLDIQSSVDKVTGAKNHHGRFNEYSPVQWFH